MAWRQPWRLEALIPGLILAAFLCDLAGRFVRIEPLTFRGDEALGQFPDARMPGPFEPNRHYHNGRSTGDLAVISNQPEYKVFRDQEFTTDGLGFRNAAGPRPLPPEVLMVGTSFTMGGGNTDGRTLPVRLEALSGRRTYNAGNANASAESILNLTRRLGMRRGLVILECLERYVGEPAPSPGGMRWVPYRDTVRAIYRTAYQRWAVSPLKVVLQRAYKSFQDDRFLPNTHKDSVAIRRLRDGRPMLFLRDLERPGRPDAIGRSVDIVAKLRDELRAEGFDFALVIVPDKLTVYRPLLREPVPEGAASEAFLAELGRSARARGINVVNLAPVLTARAVRSLENGETLYWADDTHWNPRGIEVAAEAIRDALDLGEGRHQAPSPP